MPTSTSSKTAEGKCPPLLNSTKEDASRPETRVAASTNTRVETAKTAKAAATVGTTAENVLATSQKPKEEKPELNNSATTTKKPSTANEPKKMEWSDVLAAGAGPR
jgi:hypothetical protein